MNVLPTFTVIPKTSLAGYDRIDIDLPQARIGNIRCRFMAEKVVVYSIQIFPEYQKNGYGAAAIALLKGRFRVLVADRVRFSARDFWEKMNFVALPDGNWIYPPPA